MPLTDDIVQDLIQQLDIDVDSMFLASRKSKPTKLRPKMKSYRPSMEDQEIDSDEDMYEESEPGDDSAGES